MKDKFLSRALSNTSLLPLTTFLSFNRIKMLFAGIQDESQKITLLQQSVSMSKMLKLSKCKAFLKRRIPFKKSDIDMDKMN